MITKAQLAAMAAVFVALAVTVSAMSVSDGAEGDETATTIDFATFLTNVENSNYNYNPSDVVTVKWSPTDACTVASHESNPEGCLFKDTTWLEGDGNHAQRIQNSNAQYQLFSDATDVSISNVSFLFVPADFTLCTGSGWGGTASKDTIVNAELQFLNSGNLTLTGCSFDKVIVSPFGKGDLTDNATTTIENCDFKNIYDTYAVKDIYATNATIAGCSFDNCGGGIYFEGAVQKGTYEISGNTFSNMDQNAADNKKNTRGLIQFSAKGDYSNAVIDIEENSYDGETPVIRQLNETITPAVLDAEEVKEANGFKGQATTGDSVEVDNSTMYVNAVSGDDSTADGTQEKPYKTIAKALDDAKAGDTIVLLGNAVETVTIASGKNVILDLNGFTLKNTESAQLEGTTLGGHTVTVESGAKLVVRDSSSAGTGTVDCLTHARGAVVNHGTFVLESGKLTRSAEAGASPTDNGDNSWYVVDNHGEMTVEGGSIVATGKYSSLVRNIGTSVDDRAILVVNGGNISNVFIALKNDDFSALEVNGGTVTSQEQSIQNWGVAEVNGGTLNGTVASWSYNNAEVTMAVGGDAVINGDLLATAYTADKEAVGSSVAAPQIEITGGTIDGDMSTRFGEGPYTLLPEAGDTDDYAWFQISGGTFTGELEDRFIADGSSMVPGPDGGFVVVGGDSIEIDANGKYTMTDEDNTLVSDGEYDVEISYEGGVADVTVQGTTGIGQVSVIVFPVLDPHFSGLGATHAIVVKYECLTPQSATVTVKLPLGECEALTGCTVMYYDADAGQSGTLDAADVWFSSDGTVTFVTEHSTEYDFITTVEATGQAFPPWGWDDDDEYVPPVVPVQPSDSGEGDTTKIVACAAAAVVAALMAVFLIIERRRS